MVEVDEAFGGTRVVAPACAGDEEESKDGEGAKGDTQLLRVVPDAWPWKLAPGTRPQEFVAGREDRLAEGGEVLDQARHGWRQVAQPLGAVYGVVADLAQHLAPVE